jgi:hypothetical protein
VVQASQGDRLAPSIGKAFYVRSILTNLAIVALAADCAASLGCSSGKTVCVPGQSIACVGPAACQGGQVCNADGTAYGTCQCASGSSSGGTRSTGTTGGTTSASATGGTGSGTSGGGGCHAAPISQPATTGLDAGCTPWSGGCDSAGTSSLQTSIQNAFNSNSTCQADTDCGLYTAIGNQFQMLCFQTYDIPPITLSQRGQLDQELQSILCGFCNACFAADAGGGILDSDPQARPDAGNCTEVLCVAGQCQEQSLQTGCTLDGQPSVSQDGTDCCTGVGQYNAVTNVCGACVPAGDRSQGSGSTAGADCCMGEEFSAATGLCED